MSVPKYEYQMDYIPDKNLYKAVMFARKMRRSGTKPQIAIRKAAYYYEVDMSDVAYYMGQAGGRTRNERR